MSQDQPPLEPNLSSEDDWDDALESPVSSPESSNPPTPPHRSASEGMDTLTSVRQWTAERWSTLRPQVMKQWEQFQPQTEKLWNQVYPQLEKIWQQLRLQTEKLWNQVYPQLQKTWQQIRPTLEQWTATARPLVAKGMEKIRPWWERSQAWWQSVLSKIRTRLPNAWNQTLSDRALTGAIAGVLVLVLWVGSTLMSSTPAALSQSPNPSVEPIATPVSPEPAGDRPTASPPAPALDLPPDQSLIAAIQEQVAAMTDQYASGLIQSVQANFRTGTLVVKVTSQWYNSSPPRQDALANEMLVRSRELAFSRLDLTDSNGTLLARSPVVGDRMVILKRTLS